MLTRWTDVKGHLATPEGQKLLKYSAASIISLVVSVVLLVVFDGLFGWGAVVSSTLATAIATIPSYQLNRKWAWGKSGKGDVWREVVPFWVIAFIGWGFSTYSTKLTESALKGTSIGHLEKTALIAVVYVAAFGVLWVAKFIFFNKVLFAHQTRGRAESASVDAVAG